MLRRVVLVRTDVSEELTTPFIRVTRLGELGTAVALFLAHVFLSPWWRRRYVPPKRRFLQEPHGVTSQKTTFFIVTAVKTSNLTWYTYLHTHVSISEHLHSIGHSSNKLLMVLGSTVDVDIGQRQDWPSNSILASVHSAAETFLPRRCLGTLGGNTNTKNKAIC
jgi:hypothetical protein